MVAMMSIFGTPSSLTLSSKIRSGTQNTQNKIKRQENRRIIQET
jgi:hypothetical protein